ncbi:UvrB/UvrC motif-containing protein [Bacillus rhizoplanae]|uniref:UvrB/UvrC motif-containing protein n=1 Tax=Bacillus rhizoplanae TaxID=2880966 RepID=UPI003D193613
MICQNCSSRSATLHFTKAINGKKTEIHLCEQCAQENGYTSFFQSNKSNKSSLSFHNLLAGLLHVEQPASEKETNNASNVQPLQCPKCNMTYPQFAKVGRFGCSSCYETFKEQLQPMLKRLHGGHTKHHGKIPNRIGGNIHLKKELDELKLKLQECIQQEEFEQAAEVRDKIRSIENQLREHREGE